MDANGVHFQLSPKQLELFLAPGGYFEKIIQIENKPKRRNQLPSLQLQQSDSANNGFVIPTLFNPSENEELQTDSLDDVITDFQKPMEFSPPMFSTKSLSDIMQSSARDFEFGMESSTPVMDVPKPSTVLHPGHDELMYNSTVLDYNATREWSPEEIGAVFIVCFMIPFIICSNLLVIFSVIRFRRLHTPTNYFITSLAAVDIIVGLITPLVIAVQIFHYGGDEDMNDTIVCLLPNRILMMSCGVSLLNLATIAYDRHTALICPLEYVNIMTSRKVSLLIVSSWVYSAFIVWLPLMLGWYDASFPSSQCSVDHLHQKAHILFIAAIFVPSCTIILICYSRIFLVARHHARSIAAVEFAVHRRLQVRFMIKDTKYAKTLALVIGGFLVLWLPYLVYTFTKAVCGISFDVWLETYLILLAVFNSGINPWIYAFKNNEFQAAFKRMAREHCKGIMCRQGNEKRGSLVSCVSTTPRLSRTDSRIASTILDGQTDKIIHRSLDFLNSVDSDLSEYNPDSHHDTTGQKHSDTNSKYLCGDVSTNKCEIEYKNEHQTVPPAVVDSFVREDSTKPKIDTENRDYKPMRCEDEIYNQLRTSVLIYTQKSNKKDNLSQLKKIRCKGAEIIRSSSALSSMRPTFMPIYRRPSSSLPSSPIQTHTPLKSTALRSSKSPEVLKTPTYPPFCFHPSSVSPGSKLYPKCLS